MQDSISALGVKGQYVCAPARKAHIDFITNGKRKKKRKIHFLKATDKKVIFDVDVE